MSGSPIKINAAPKSQTCLRHLPSCQDRTGARLVPVTMRALMGGNGASQRSRSGSAMLMTMFVVAAFHEPPNIRTALQEARHVRNSCATPSHLEAFARRLNRARRRAGRHSGDIPVVIVRQAATYPMPLEHRQRSRSEFRSQSTHGCAPRNFVNGNGPRHRTANHFTSSLRTEKTSRTSMLGSGQYAC